jgi:hypothetical protein
MALPNCGVSALVSSTGQVSAYTVERALLSRISSDQLTSVCCQRLNVDTKPLITEVEMRRNLMNPLQENCKHRDLRFRFYYQMTE